MFEARVVISKILKNVIKREESRDKLLSLIEKNFGNKDEIKDRYEQLILISSKIIKEIGALGQEHRMFKRPFIYFKVDYID